jgi:hypothetical protein
MMAGACRSLPQFSEGLGWIVHLFTPHDQHPCERAAERSSSRC